MSFLTLLKEKINNDGMTISLKKIAIYPIKKLKRFSMHWLAINKLSNEKKFEWIYSSNYWGSSESGSGVGSSLEYTQNLRSHLGPLFDEYNVKEILDAPCGDFNWMKEFLHDYKRRSSIKYIGGDIVGVLIDENVSKYQAEDVSFVKIDITQDKLPTVDLMICRDCLFHLSYADINLFLKNFLDSGIKYLLTTTHLHDIENKDIKTGDFRHLNLFLNPFFLSNKPLAKIDDWIPPDYRRQMCLWSRDQIAESLKKWK